MPSVIGIIVSRKGQRRRNRDQWKGDQKSKRERKDKAIKGQMEKDEKIKE